MKSVKHTLCDMYDVKCRKILCFAIYNCVVSNMRYEHTKDASSIHTYIYLSREKSIFHRYEKIRGFYLI
jgi:hypothetical protein